MARLITVTAYTRDSTSFASASPMALDADNFIRVENASTKQKMANPSASGSINTAIVTNEESQNSGETHVYLVNETISTIVTASA